MIVARAIADMRSPPFDPSRQTAMFAIDILEQRKLGVRHQGVTVLLALGAIGTVDQVLQLGFGVSDFRAHQLGDLGQGEAAAVYDFGARRMLLVEERVKSSFDAPRASPGGAKRFPRVLDPVSQVGRTDAGADRDVPGQKERGERPIEMEQPVTVAFTQLLPAFGDMREP